MSWLSVTSTELGRLSAFRLGSWPSSRIREWSLPISVDRETSSNSKWVRTYKISDMNINMSILEKEWEKIYKDIRKEYPCEDPKTKI